MGWNRYELKMKARQCLQVNMKTAILVNLLFIFVSSGIYQIIIRIAGNPAAVLSQIDPSKYPDLYLEKYFTIMPGYMLLSSVITFFLANPLNVGCCGYYSDALWGSADFSRLKSGFTPAYAKNVFVMFLRRLFIFLWSLLLIFPGIIKSYEYKMVPYILADNPDISTKEAFDKSREMMYGHKMNAFILDLSFIPWFLLSVLTFGILYFIYVGPFYNFTRAALYHTLSQNKNA